MTRRVLVLACALLQPLSAWLARPIAPASRPWPRSSLDMRSSIRRCSRASRRLRLGGARSRVIVRTVDGRPATQLIQAVNGVAGRYFPWLGGQVAIVPDAALDRLARRPEVAGISLDRPVRGTMDRTTTATGARWVTEHLGVTGSASAWRPSIRASIPGTRTSTAGSCTSPTSSTPSRFAYDDYGHGTHVAGIIAGSGRASAADVERRAARRRARRAPRRAEGARRHRQRLHEQRHCRHRLRDREPRDLQHPRPEPVSRGRRVRIVQQGSADARRQARRRLGHRRRCRRGQPRPRRRRGSRSTAASRRPATHPGC